MKAVRSVVPCHLEVPVTGYEYRCMFAGGSKFAAIDVGLFILGAPVEGIARAESRDASGWHPWFRYWSVCGEGIWGEVVEVDKPHVPHA